VESLHMVALEPGEHIDAAELVQRMRQRTRCNDPATWDAAFDTMRQTEGINASSVSSLLQSLQISLNKVELDNVVFYLSQDCALCELLEAAMAPPAEPPPSPSKVDHKIHLALSGVSHVEYGKQYKPFPPHWGDKPNAQMKGFEGIMHELPGGYGTGNSAMVKWVNLRMAKDGKSYTDEGGGKPFPYGNYSFGCSPTL